MRLRLPVWQRRRKRRSARPRRVLESTLTAQKGGWDGHPLQSMYRTAFSRAEFDFPVIAGEARDLLSIARSKFSAREAFCLAHRGPSTAHRLSPVLRSG